ncbi:MAG: hypothetical protein K2L46_00705 [Paramuribaculum sp.]|nr:hypothetical protein [Paramuribaculum sp.]MDE6487778.1 hypothetical protein [Paramuribaculum sp.]
MDFKQIKELAALPDNELTARLIDLFGIVLQSHDSGKGLSAFDWHDLNMSDDGKLYLSGIEECGLDEDVRDRNYNDYAAIIYCASTKQKSAEPMSWDAGRKIRQPVLREIVLTLCGRNASVDPLIDKLRQPYIDEESFFDGYTTVDEKDASEAFRKAEQIRMLNERDSYLQAEVSSKSSGSPWYKGIGVFILIGLCSGGYKAYKASEKQKRAAAIELINKQAVERRQMREQLRQSAPVELIRGVNRKYSVAKGENPDSQD